MAVQYSAAQEVAEALGLSVAANHERRPRWAARGMALGVSSRSSAELCVFSVRPAEREGRELRSVVRCIYTAALMQIRSI